jgi:hypothetical protein
MEQYWLKLYTDTNNSIPDSAVLPTPPPKKTRLGYVNLGLPSNFNLTDDNLNELGWGETSFNTQSVDEEYHSYGFGVLTKLDVDILKFWEVRVQIIFNCSVSGSIST